ARYSWMMRYPFPLMASIQEISARVGRVTGRGIAGNVCRHYPGWLLQIIVVLLFVANAVNIGADLGAMGDALKLLLPARLHSMSCCSASSAISKARHRPPRP